MNFNIRSLLSLTGATMAAAVPGIAFAQAAAETSPDQLFEETVFFGDSLTDAGFYRPLLPVSVRPVTGQFIDNPGKVWAQYLADYYGTQSVPNGNGQTGTNYAAGGARNGINTTGALGPIPSTNRQVTNYLATNGGRANPNALYSVWSGANDLFSITNAGASEATTIANAVTSQVGNVTTLRNAGAQYIMVFNTPDLGSTPAFVAGSPADQAIASRITRSYNSSLFSGLASAGHAVIPVDSYSLFREVLAAPALYGFTNVTGTACQPQITANSLTCNPTSLITPDAPNTHLFADGVHPTSKAHRLLSQYAVSVIEAPRQIAVLPHSAKVIGRSRADAVSAHAGQRADDGTRLWIDLRLNMQGSDSLSKRSGARPAVVFGVDRTRGDLAFGLFGAYSDTRYEFFQDRGDYRQEDMGIGAFVAWRGEQLWMNGQVSHSWQRYRVNRDIVLGTAARTHSGKTDGRNTTLGVNLGYSMQTGPVRHGPMVGLLAQWIRVDGFNESEPQLSTAMGYLDQSYNSATGQFGYQAELSTSVGISPYLQVAYEREFGNYPAQAFGRALSIPGSLPFAVPGIIYDRSYGALSGGVRAKVGPGQLDVGGSTTFEQAHGSDSAVYLRFSMGI